MNSDLSVWLYKQVYCRLIGSVLPAHWFGPRPPETSQLSQPQGRIKLEIVSHCWQYAHLSMYQLSSLVNHPPKDIDLTYTLFYAEEDEGTTKLVETFAQMDIPNVTWQWRPMTREQIFRRAIGRNQAALATKADWIWFADCDLIFHAGCLDSITPALRDKATRLAYPASEQITELLPAEDPIVNLPTEQPTVVDIDPTMFSTNQITKAKGAFQIVHGEVARTCGYCKDLKHYQQPTNRWRKTFEDTAFRRLISDEGLAVPITGLHRIRHQVKGRYAKDSALSQVRQNIRQASDRHPGPTGLKEEQHD